MKTKEELAALKNEFEVLNAKLAELSDEELKAVAGGIPQILPPSTLEENTYNGMFSGCTGLDTPHDLPAKSLD